MAEIASAFVTIAPSAKGFSKSLTSQVGGDVKSAGTSIGRTFGKLFVLGAGVIAAAGIGSLLKGSIGEAREAQKVGAATEQIIKSTGGAAQVTADQVGAMAGRLSSVTGIDDEVIQQASNLLLTFKNVKNYVDGQFVGTFDRATAAAVDLSAAGFGSTDSAAKTLGKALNDPIKGITALSRAGVTFSDAQKKQIQGFVDSGDAAKAQNLILKEVESQVGGVAAATATTGEKASVAFGNIKEAIGTALLPLVDTLGRQFLKVAPAVQKGIGNIGPLFQRARAFLQPFIASIVATAVSLGTQLAPIVGTIASAVATFVGQIQSGTGAGGAFASIIQGLASALGAVFGFISSNQEVVGTFVAVIVAAAAAAKIFAAAQLLVNLALSANPIGLIVIAIAALAAGLVYAYKKSDTFRAIVDKSFSVVKTVATAVAGFLSKYVPKAFSIIANLVGKYVSVYRTVVVTAFNVVKSIISNVANFVVASAKKYQAFQSAVANIVSQIIAKFTQFATAVRQKVSNAVDFLKGIPGKVKSAVGDLSKTLIRAGEQIIEGLIKGIGNKLGALGDKLGSVGGFIKDHKGPPAKDKVMLVPAGKMIMDGLISGIQSRQGALGDALAKVGDQVEKGGEKAAKKLKERLSKLRDTLATAKSDFASLVEPIASNFTQGLFDFDTAGAFTANLTAVRGTISSLLSNFKTLVGNGLSPGFLYKLFQEGGPGLIAGLAALPKEEAQGVGALFGQVTSLADELGGQVAGATDRGLNLIAEQKKTNTLLEKLLDEAKKNPDKVADANAQPHKRARRRAVRAA